MKALLVIGLLVNGSPETITVRIPDMEACITHAERLTLQAETITGGEWRRVSCIPFTPWRFPL